MEKIFDLIGSRILFIILFIPMMALWFVVGIIDLRFLGKMMQRTGFQLAGKRFTV